MANPLLSILQKLAPGMGLARYAADVYDSMTEEADKSPVEAEIKSELDTQASFIAFGTVKSNNDPENAGRLYVKSPAFGDEPKWVDYVSPVAGAGYGLFAVPGIGACVVIGKTAFVDPPAKYFWFGSLYTPTRQVASLKAQPNAYDKTQMARTEVLDNGQPVSDDPIVSYGVPNEAEIYTDNNLPDSYVLKHPCGHSISIIDKRSPERTVNEIKLKTAENKKLIMSDAPPAAGGECILLIDENDNAIKITSMSDTNPDSIAMQAGKNITLQSREGDIHQIIQEGSGDFDIDNAGSGDIKVEAMTGGVTIKSPTSISLQCGSSKIEIGPASITIDSPVVTVTGGAGDVQIMGISHVGHIHGTPLIPPITTPPR